MINLIINHFCFTVFHALSVFTLLTCLFQRVEEVTQQIVFFSSVCMCVWGFSRSTPVQALLLQRINIFNDNVFLLTFFKTMVCRIMNPVMNRENVNYGFTCYTELMELSVCINHQVCLASARQIRNKNKSSLRLSFDG